jgi:hypothetical protein
VALVCGERYRLGKKKPLAMGERDSNSGDDELPPARNAGGKPPWVGASDDGEDYLAENRFPDVRAQRHEAPPPVKMLHPQPLRGGGADKGGADKGGYDETLQQFVQPLYVGDRVRVRASAQVGAHGGRGPRRGSLGSHDPAGGGGSGGGKAGAPQGQVLFVGPTGFSGGRAMVGLRLDDRPSGGGSDGKEQGERHFRCEPGMGCFVLQVRYEKP